MTAPQLPKQIPAEHMSELRRAAHRMARKGQMPRHEALVECIIQYASLRPHDPAKGELRPWVAKQVYPRARLTMARRRGPVTVSERLASSGVRTYSVSLNSGWAGDSYEGDDGRDGFRNGIPADRFRELLGCEPAQADGIEASDRRAQALAAMTHLTPSEMSIIVSRLGLVDGKVRTFAEVASAVGTNRHLARYHYNCGMARMRRMAWQWADLHR